MKISISEVGEKVEIKKNMRRDYIRNKIVFILINFINLFVSYNTNIGKFLLSLFLFLIPLVFMYQIIKYLYCDEIINIDANETMTLSFILDNKILLEETIKISDIAKIEIQKNSLFNNSFGIGGKNKVRAGFIEKRRKLKIILKNKKVYSWGVDLKKKEAIRIKTFLEEHFVKIAQENMLGNEREYRF